MPDTRYNTLEQIDNKFGETIKNGDTVPFLEVCVSHRRHFRQRNSEHRTALSLSIHLIALSLSPSFPLRVPSPTLPLARMASHYTIPFGTYC